MIDPRIPLMGNAPPSFDIGGTLGKIAQIKRMEAISQQEQQEMAIRQREQQEKDQITAVLRETQGDLTTAIPRIRQINPLVAAKIETTMTDAQEAKVKLAKARLDHDLNAAEFISRQLNGVTDQQTYDYARAAIGGAGLPTQQMNPQFDPGYVESLKAKGMSVKEELDLKKSEIDRLFQERKFQAEQQNVSADNTRADTAEARQAARDAQQATVEGARLGLERQRVGLEGQRVKLAQQEAGGGGDVASKSDAELIDAVMANPAIYAGLTPTIKSRLAGPLATKGFTGFAASAAGGKTAGPDVGKIFNEIETLSKRINTNEGSPLSNVAGMIRRGAAAGNLDNDVSEYQALVEGMIPMVARAVGHTGVLTQQDVDSVRAMFPKVSDNKVLAQNKINRVKTLIGGNPVTTNTKTAKADPLGIR